MRTSEKGAHSVTQLSLNLGGSSGRVGTWGFPVWYSEISLGQRGWLVLDWKGSPGFSGSCLPNVVLPGWLPWLG